MLSQSQPQKAIHHCTLVPLTKRDVCGGGGGAGGVHGKDSQELFPSSRSLVQGHTDVHLKHS